MELDQLKPTWKKNISITSNKISEENSMDHITQQILALDKNIRMRTIFGTATFIIVLSAMIVFEYLLHSLGKSPIAISGIAVWIVSIAIAVLALNKVSQQNQEYNSALSIRESLENKLTKVNNEIRFYKSIVLWLLIPIGAGFTLILIGTQATLLMVLFEAGIFLLICHSSHKHNQKYIAKELDPIKHILLEKMEAFSTNED